MFKTIIPLFFILSSCQLATSESEPKVFKDLDQFRVCSQNLQRFGQFQKKKRKKHESQKKFLVTRMFRAKCSVVALQEIYLDKKGKGALYLEELVSALEKRTKRSFSYYIAKSKDRYIANGFLYADDIGDVKKTSSLWKTRLPKIKNYSPPRYFTRGPAMLHIELSEKIQRSHSISKDLILFSMHFKSQRNGWKDPMKRNFEAIRMEMSAGLKEYALEIASDYKDATLLILGDRNNDIGASSVDIMSGELELKDFSKGAGCKVTKNLEPSCSGVSIRKQKLIPLFEYRREHSPKGKFPNGSHKYKGKEHQLDEIYVLPKDLKRVTRKKGQIAIGFEGQFYKGSDHKMLWVELLGK